MVLAVKHKFVSAKADSADASIVRPSNWNDSHDINIAQFSLVGKATAGAGVATEVALGAGLSFVAGALAANTGTYDQASITAALALKFDKTGGALSGPINISAAGNPSVRLIDTNSGLGRYLYHDGTNIGFLSSTGGWIARVVDSGAFWTAQMGDVAGYIESRAVANAQAYTNNCVQNSQAAGYVEVGVKTGSGGAGDFNFGGYYVTRIYKSGVENIQVGGRQPQLLVPNRGWFAAFNF